MKIFNNIKFRLTAWYLFIVTVLVALFGISSYFFLVEGLSRNIVTPYDMRIADIAFLPDGSGRINAESKPGRGSTLTVYLPGKAVSQS